MIGLFDEQPLSPKPSHDPSNTGPAPPDEIRSFGWLHREGERAVMLEVRQANGLITAYNYAWLESAEFNPSEGITLNFSGRIVKLIGRNLNAEVRPSIRLFESLVRHRVLWMHEADKHTVTQSMETDVVIEEVKLE